jgi:predicted nucleotidyltransferase
MANFHNDEWIMKRVEEHYKEALEHFPEDRIVGIFLQGSQNYGLDTENSDIDTKLIVTPTFNDLAFNLKPVSTTHIRENNEHIDFKDIRLMLQTFRKHNINFIEILFTPYYILNPKYEYFWEQLIAKREMIARSNP